MRLQYLGVDLFEAHVFLLELESWSDWPATLSLPSRHFRLLTVGDAGRVGGEELSRFADAALGAGCVYLCAWGPGCMRVHDTFDYQDLELPQGATVMTTSHAHESLEDAIEFLLISAWPDKAFAETCRAALIAVVGDGSLADQVKSLAPRFMRPRDHPGETMN
jgi:hypothetical protein